MSQKLICKYILQINRFFSWLVSFIKTQFKELKLVVWETENTEETQEI